MPQDLMRPDRRPSLIYIFHVYVYLSLFLAFRQVAKLDEPQCGRTIDKLSGEANYIKVLLYILYPSRYPPVFA